MPINIFFRITFPFFRKKVLLLPKFSNDTVQKQMNYEELLSLRNADDKPFCRLPMGRISRRSIDGKYLNVVDLDERLSADALFRADLGRELEAMAKVKSPHQLRFILTDAASAGSPSATLAVERGVYVPLAQLLFESPSLVANAQFLDSIVGQAFEAARQLHRHGVWHVCFAPENVFIRRGDNQLLLLSHGSFYLDLPDQGAYYGPLADYVAPEVLSHGAVDGRSDVYSLGRFMESLYAMANMPVEVKRMVKKATAAEPDRRYASVEKMQQALTRMRSARHTFATFAVAMAVALACVWGYFTLMPEQSDMEYVKPAPAEPEPDILDDGFDPATELGFVPRDSTDSVGSLTAKQRKKLDMFEKKAEDIFRKRYEREADRILSKVYNRKNMSMTEKNFLATSRKTLEELSKAREEIASQTAMPNSKSQLVATEIINKVTERKMNEIK